MLKKYLNRRLDTSQTKRFKRIFKKIFCINTLKSLILRHKDGNSFVGPIAHSVRATDS